MRRRRHLSQEQLAAQITYVSRTGQRYRWELLIEAMECGEMNANPILWLAIAQALHRVRPCSAWEFAVWRREVCGVMTVSDVVKDAEKRVRNRGEKAAESERV